MALTRKQSAAVHVGKKELGLTDDEYRAILCQVAGVTSSRELDSFGFESSVIERFASLGWRSDVARPYLGRRPGMVTPGQVTLMRTLWDRYTGGEGDDLTLGKWLNWTFGVSALRFVTVAQARKAVEALKAMVAREEAGRQ